MKKTVIIILAIVILATVSACAGGKDIGGKTGTDTGEKSTPGASSKNTVEFEGDSFALDREISHGALHYMESSEKMESNGLFSVRDIRYLRNGETMLAVSIVYFENQTIDEVMAETEAAMTDKKINGIDYKYFESDMPFEDKTAPGHSYACFFDGTTYVITFVSEYDMTSFEKAFMNCVTFGNAD